MTNAGSDLELVRLIRRGDERAARELLARVGPSLRSIARVVLRDDPRSEDVVQQALCRLLELRERQVREIRDIGAFLACMVRRLALNEARSEGRARRRERDSARRDVGPTPDVKGANAAHLDQALSEAIASLPDELAEIVLLRHVGGLTFDQLAMTLDQSRGTIVGRHRRAMEELNRILAGANAVGAAHENTGVAR